MYVGEAVLEARAEAAGHDVPSLFDFYPHFFFMVFLCCN